MSFRTGVCLDDAAHDSFGVVVEVPDDNASIDVASVVRSAEQPGRGTPKAALPEESAWKKFMAWLSK